ncbi:hypothetical protein ACFV6E_37635 [Streptomyces sp. NPDC059785]|uniref:hypothetical protein n=1 Tax=Streptomyces sp. NPDC059785 TaxID=3346945 RepID=UPI003664D965
MVRFTGFSTGSAPPAGVLDAQIGGDGAPTAGGYTLVLWIAAGICVWAAALTWFLPERSSAATSDAPRRSP